MMKSYAINDEGAHMEEMADGLDIDQNTLIAVLQNKLAQATVREAQLESAVQMLMNQKSNLELTVNAMSEVKEEISARSN